MVAPVIRATMLPLAALAALAGGARGEPLPDPTRPPAALLAAPAPAASSASGALQLQSVLIGRGRPPAAVISGELVLLGGPVRDARLVRLTATRAVLRGPHGETTLSLPAPDLDPAPRARAGVPPATPPEPIR